MTVSPIPSHPLFSVVTIAFNDLDGLRGVADSLFAQDWTNWEWVVVDGASHDGSADYLASIADPRLRYVSEPDRGIYDAMNKGIEQSRGEYLMFMNSGDAFATPDELRLAASDVADWPDLLYGDAIEVDVAGDHYKRARSHRFAWYSMFTHHQAIYYRHTVFDHIRYDTSFRLAADWALTLDVLRIGQNIRRVHRPVCRFLRGGASYGDRTLADAEAARVYREHTGLPWPLAALTFRIKTGVNTIRSRFPTLYDRLRMRG